MLTQLQAADGGPRANAGYRLRRDAGSKFLISCDGLQPTGSLDYRSPLPCEGRHNSNSNYGGRKSVPENGVGPAGPEKPDNAVAIDKKTLPIIRQGLVDTLQHFLPRGGNGDRHILAARAVDDHRLICRVCLSSHCRSNHSFVMACRRVALNACYRSVFCERKKETARL